jgi:hypothetical protein
MYDAVLGYIQTTQDLDIPDNSQTGYPVILDIADSYTATEVVYDVGVEDLEQSYVDLPWNNAKIVQGTGCAVAGQTAQAVITDLGTGMWRYLLDDTTVPTGASVIAGLGYTSLVKPTMPFIRDATGAAIKNSKLVVTEFVIYYDESGTISSEMNSKYRSVPTTHSNLQIVTAGDPDDPEGKGIRSGYYSIPWGERSDWSDLTISSNDVRPMTILEIEWIGQVLSRGRRV